MDNHKSQKSFVADGNHCSCDCSSLHTILAKYDNDSSRLMDILIAVQEKAGCIQEKAVKEIAKALNLSKVDVEQTLSFYHFFSDGAKADYAVYLNDSVVAEMMGRE
ncbi:MAG: hypothetical protein HN692_04170, partial [Candidatus Cloacimonetes bacterium]|nr:hypothetical protein [Candidatus Cloacimonadota bacterium]